MAQKISAHVRKELDKKKQNMPSPEMVSAAKRRLMKERRHG